MIAIGNREAVIQNLEDAGCEPEMIRDFLGWFDKGQQKKQLELLEHQREHLLGRVHKEEKRISCLDYLIYQIQGNQAGKRVRPGDRVVAGGVDTPETAKEHRALEKIQKRGRQV